MYRQGGSTLALGEKERGEGRGETTMGGFSKGQLVILRKPKSVQHKPKNEGKGHERWTRSKYSKENLSMELNA